ncbi:hypothetical protein [Haloprofundus halobius]|uniref:hypothetical protein n=1 Tax=Haloprofundus halobius TaxID=2876194 RepID=UPI001CCF60E0|nr:hypothetical protein [Haloprofundus halobius]
MSHSSSTKAVVSPSLNRRTYLKTALGAILGVSLTGRSAAQTGVIPPTALYEVTMQGATKYGPFARTAQLSLFPPFDP